MTAMTEQMLIAFADGELNEIDRRRAASRIAEDPQLAAALDRQKRLRERLASRYDPVAAEEVPERLRALLERGVNVVAIEDARGGWRPRARWLGAIAATFVAGFLAAQLVPPGAGSDEGVEGGRLLAVGPLAQALETQLASNQPSDAATRIGVSFAAQDGRMCRSFESSELAGLACREAGGWELVTTVRAGGGRQGQYRQAESGTALIMQVSQELMTGEAFDADAERRARDGGWRVAPEPGANAPR